jgi:chemotaxis protein histidine kinase CheA
LDADNQQRILGYFIEEAKEHLETLEKGILDLADVANDSERVNELFRAAHSVKGGAAMLGYTSIQKTAHRLEDAFKIFKENDIPVDKRLESLFFDSYDVLQELLTKLQGPFGLKSDEADAIVKSAEPKFVQLQSYLEKIVSGEPVEEETPAPVAVAPVVASKSSDQETSVLSGNIKTILKQMLQEFKQPATPESRKNLQQFCIKLVKLADQERGWQRLLKYAHQAIANPKHSYATLAPVIIKELKQGCDYMELGNPEQIMASESLQRLATASAPQVLVPIEPKLAAKALTQVFNKKQLSQLIQLLRGSASN